MANDNDKPETPPQAGGSAADKAGPEEPSTATPSPGDVPPQRPQDGASSPHQGPSPARANTGKAKPRKGTAKGKLLLVAVLVLLGVGGYYGWRHFGDALLARTQTQPLPTTAAPVSSDPDPTPRSPAEAGLGEADQASALGPRLATLEERQEEEFRALEAQVADLQLQLNSQQQRLRQLSTTSREDWLLAEAEYLLRLASQRLVTEGQTGNAVALMTAADAILRELDDPGLFAVRQALARDITRLRGAGVVDREGIYVQLDALIASVPDLRVPLVEEEGPAVEVAPEEAATWYQRLGDNAWRALSRMSGIVRVERLDVPAAPPLLPSEQALLQLSVRTLLEQAQLALMRGEQHIYTASLTRARNSIAASFPGSDMAEVFDEQLAQLASLQVTRPVPDVAASIVALQDYIALWHNRYPGADQDGDGGEAP